MSDGKMPEVSGKLTPEQQRAEYIKNDNGFHPREANKVLGALGHSGFLGIDYSDHGDDWVELFMDWRSDLVADADSGIFASSAVITLIDNATSLALWTKQGSFQPQVTMDLRLDYLRPSPKEARIYGRGTCYHITQNVGFVRGTAHNGDPDDPIAFASGTFMRLHNSGNTKT